MKKILYITFYYEPDLCAGSFRNTPLSELLGKKLEGKAEIDVMTTMPNRYDSFKVQAPKFEEKGNIRIHRFQLPPHRSGIKDQMNSFKTYWSSVLKAVDGKEYDLVFASSSRLFSAVLGSYIARRKKAELFLDIRDIFKDTIEDIITNPLFQFGSKPLFSFLEKYAFGRAENINVVSEGFLEYLKKVSPKSKFHFFPNGIDNVFLNRSKENNKSNTPKVITYAGNIGEGQGLELTLPKAAKQLEGEYEFHIIGGGGTLIKLIEEINKEGVTNIKLMDPVKRSDLLSKYDHSDVLFLQLNDLDAFRKVLPSKIFEYASFDKPIVAGVAGYSANFLKQNVSGSFVYNPGDVIGLVNILKKLPNETYSRNEFVESFSRSKINEGLTDQILKALNES